MGRTDNNGLATLERIGSPGSIGETENDGLRKSGTWSKSRHLAIA